MQNHIDFLMKAVFISKHCLKLVFLFDISVITIKTNGRFDSQVGDWYVVIVLTNNNSGPHANYTPCELGPSLNNEHDSKDCEKEH